MPSSNEKSRFENLEIFRPFKPLKPTGGWPIPYLRFRNLKDLLKDTPRLNIEGNFRNLSNEKEMVSINDMINGGLKVPHLHLDDEIFLFEKPMLKKYLHAIADEIDNIKDFSELHRVQ